MNDVVGSNSIGCLIMVSWPFGIARMPRRLSVLAVTKRAKTCGLDWFGFGSRITITTTDIHLLHVHGVERAYEVEELNHEEALELFNWRAFRGNKVIQHSNGLPLSLEIIGSILCGKTELDWKSALDAYERIPHKNIQEILRVSYDSLQEFEKKMFLDMTCFFKGYRLGEVINFSYWDHSTHLNRDSDEPQLVCKFSSAVVVAQGAKVTFTNKCTYTVWPVTLTGDKKPQLSTTGFELASGASNSVDIPSPYSRVRSGLKPNAPTTTEGSTAPLLTAPPVKSHAMVPVQSRRQPRQKLPLQKTEDKISMRKCIIASCLLHQSLLMPTQFRLLPPFVLASKTRSYSINDQRS
ncbi:TMV resistance protein N [Glycine soja]